VAPRGKTFGVFILRTIILSEKELKKEIILKLETAEVGLLDKEDAKSLYNKLPPKLQEVLEGIKDELGESMPEYEWENLGITKTDRMLRASFWLEFQRSQDENRKMNMKRLLSEVTTEKHLYGTVLRHKHRARYLFTPPARQEVTNHALLNIANDAMYAVLTIPVKKDGSKQSMDLFNLQMKIWEKLNDRVYGSAIQRSQVKEEKSISVNIDNKSVSEIDKELQELRESTKDVVIDGSGYTIS
jgi:hypothetical protein